MRDDHTVFTFKVLESQACAQLYIQLRIELPRALCMLGKHSTKAATSLAGFWGFILVGLVLDKV